MRAFLILGAIGFVLTAVGALGLWAGFIYGSNLKIAEFTEYHDEMEGKLSAVFKRLQDINATLLELDEDPAENEMERAIGD